MIVRLQIYDKDKELFRIVRDLDIDKWESLTLFSRISDEIEKSYEEIKLKN